MPDGLGGNTSGRGPEPMLMGARAVAPDPIRGPALNGEARITGCYERSRQHSVCAAEAGREARRWAPDRGPTGCTHLAWACIRCTQQPGYAGLRPLRLPSRKRGSSPRRRGPIPDSRCRRSRWRAGRTAGACPGPRSGAAARTEAGPRLGGRGDGWGNATPRYRTEMCESGRIGVRGDELGQGRTPSGSGGRFSWKG